MSGFDLNVADIAEVWRRGSVVTSWLLDLTSEALARDATLEHFSGNVEDSGEGPLDRRGGDRGSRAGRRAGGIAVRAVPLAAGSHLRRKGAVGDAVRLRRPRGASREEARMTIAVMMGVVRHRQDHHRQADGGTAWAGRCWRATSYTRPRTWRRCSRAHRWTMRTAGRGCMPSPTRSTRGGNGGVSGVVACSALKRAYRDILIGPRPDVVLVYLQGSQDADRRSG